MMDRMTSNLKLTPKQKAETQAIARDAQTKMQDIRNDSSLSREQRREKMRAARNESMQKLYNTLTPEQREEMGKRRDGNGWRAERGGFKGRRGGPGGPPKGR